MAGSLDGTTTVQINSGTNIAFPPLTTTKPYDVLVMFFDSNSSGDITSITDTAGLTWTKRVEVVNPGFPGGEWWAPAVGILTGVVVTVHFSASISQFDGLIMAINGANPASPFDTNVSVPAAANSGTAILSTTGASTFGIGMYRFSSGVWSPGGGWTVLPFVNNLGTAWQSFTTPQTSKTLPAPSGSNEWAIDALLTNFTPPSGSTSSMFFNS